MLTHQIESLDTESFRRELAGLAEIHTGECGGESSPASYGDAAALLCVALSEQFGESLDRTTLWDRISSGILTAAAKTDDGDLAWLLSMCLEHVKASPASCATSEVVARLMATLEMHAEWRIGFVNYLTTHHYVVIVRGRDAWQRHKEARATAGKDGESNE